MALETHEIPREQWGVYFDDFSRDLPDYLATVEVLGGEIGAEPEAARPHLAAITYDDKDDILVIGLDAQADDLPEDVEHIVYRPRKILVAVGEREVAFEIEDAESAKTVLRLDRVG